MQGLRSQSPQNLYMLINNHIFVQLHLKWPHAGRYKQLLNLNTDSRTHYSCVIGGYTIHLFSFHLNIFQPTLIQQLSSLKLSYGTDNSQIFHVAPDDPRFTTSSMPATGWKALLQRVFTVKTFYTWKCSASAKKLARWSSWCTFEKW